MSTDIAPSHSSRVGPASGYARCRLRSTILGLSAHEEAAPGDWLGRAGRNALIVQTLSQRRGYAITLLAFDQEGVDDDEDDR